MTERTWIIPERRKKPKALPEICPWHTPEWLGYLSASADAEERIEGGERQSQCPICRLWLWPHEMGDKP